CVRVLLRGDLVLLHGERSPGRVGVLQGVEREPGLERRAELFTEPLLRDCCEFVVSRRHGGYPLLESNRVDQLQLDGAGLRLRRLDTKSRRSVVRVPLSTTEATRLVCRPRRDERGPGEQHGHGELETALPPGVGNLLLAPGLLAVLLRRGGWCRRGLGHRHGSQYRAVPVRWGDAADQQQPPTRDLVNERRRSSQ